jgi:hypothetical protein
VVRLPAINANDVEVLVVKPEMHILLAIRRLLYDPDIFIDADILYTSE